MNYERSVVDVFNETNQKYQNNPAFTCMGRTLSFKDIDALSAKFASYLQNHTSLEPGDRIAVQLPNLLQYPVVVFGAMRAGMTIVNTNPLYTPRELEHQLKDSGAKALVVLSNIATAAAEVISKTPVKHVIVTNIADLHTPVKRLLINSVVKYVKKMVPEFSFPNQIAFTKAIKLGEQKAYQPVTVNHEDIAVLQYTGGTTGVAKGAMLLHSNLVANMEQVREHLGDAFREAEELYVCPLPLYHIYAFTIHCMCLYSRGNESLLIPNPRDIPAFVKELKGKSITGFVGLNTLFNALCHNEDFKQLDFSSLRTTSSGGMALTNEVATRWEKVAGIRPAEGYGLTETSPVVCANKPSEICPGSVGTPVPGTEIKTIDENGAETELGAPGELCVRGPQVMKGYWKRPEATAEVIDEQGWFKTGDVATIDEKHFVRIVDRKKDMIIVSGFNVYPNEVEDVISSHPKVLEAAAIGVPDAKSGEAVKVFVVKEEDSLTDKDVIDYCRERLTAYKVPRMIEFRDDLPKSNVGKVLRKELRK
ncbi:AMP-binding protein [Marinibactrum halimedae]|uniref:Long-chain-fatty-acid--CoA ligase n=1 Tax=Marinibactrum halimedae TaxID=1444977 RepID=A0AA37T5S1_9GAMM|nr:AMP-binding protein [Marinibactrum halimedae]MCD9459423.1 AMP-binding protein [Marinibactrum halimedae]GLS27510.1 long-chain-fatty-acid--CoA ligase [Marinibactrum halimedae]